jgi:hypothetical protein
MIMSKTQSGIFAEVPAALRETAMRKFGELGPAERGMIGFWIIVFIVLVIVPGVALVLLALYAALAVR